MRTLPPLFKRASSVTAESARHIVAAMLDRPGADAEFHLPSPSPETPTAAVWGKKNRSRTDRTCGGNTARPETSGSQK